MTGNRTRDKYLEEEITVITESSRDDVDLLIFMKETRSPCIKQQTDVRRKR